MPTRGEPKAFSPDGARLGSSREKVSERQREENACSQGEGATVSSYLTLWTLLFVLITSKFLYYMIEHFLDELVPPRSGVRLAFLSAVTLLATFLYFSCTEHRIKRIESLQREKEMLRLLLCGEESCE